MVGLELVLQRLRKLGALPSTCSKGNRFETKNLLAGFQAESTPPRISAARKLLGPFTPGYAQRILNPDLRKYGFITEKNKARRPKEENR